jgi:DNA-binding transcriptional MerR regulator
MAYTVKKLSELSGVTVRTLHFYEEKDLLKPAYYGSNGYRYYEEKELLQLQQILFFKELGFTLKQIRKVLGQSDFNQLAALYSHKQALSQEWEKIGRLIGTIDKTIKHVKGQKKMKDKEMFEGFGLVTKATPAKSYFAAEELVLKSVKKPTAEKKEKPYYENIIKTSHDIFKKVAQCIEMGLEPTSDEVERLIKKHHAFMEQTHKVTKQVYMAYAELYQEHPEFRKQLEPFHPQLADFMAEAMRVFAQKKLS